eukprot:CAMPEP_0206044898 /NCGR_PEP_ID=MMETSP1466-20131121/14312_1 /ASSEMBLY_ACC=CAM_ASM_001126 /TAXON_ID=44452 /ORGANISM="Pavlova gyrans, Strain CCMP608" /LENGTH=177 /DNA_ID=CAMNT_0053419813 /DNA_START=122 /DNA_END=655 /DNA_ORIENTATION=-
MAVMAGERDVGTRAAPSRVPSGVRAVASTRPAEVAETGLLPRGRATRTKRRPVGAVGAVALCEDVDGGYVHPIRAVPPAMVQRASWQHARLPVGRYCECCGSGRRGGGWSAGAVAAASGVLVFARGGDGVTRFRRRNCIHCSALCAWVLAARAPAVHELAVPHCRSTDGRHRDRITR